MKKFETLRVEEQDGVMTVWLNRPEIRNAFNEAMISELLEVFESVNKRDDLRLVFLKGKGSVFCAGADLNWMRDVTNFNYKENFDESYRLSRCFHAIYTCQAPTISVVHGAAIGGANGFLAACDLAVCESETVFSMSEVKIGIIPACISPYVLKRVGEFRARELMITGRRIRGNEAEEMGLVNKSLAQKDLDIYLSETSELIRSSGPQAVRQCKKLIGDVVNTLSMDQALEYTAEMIATIRISEEGQEGMRAFLEKRKPSWVKKLPL